MHTDKSSFYFRDVKNNQLFVKAKNNGCYAAVPHGKPPPPNTILLFRLVLQSPAALQAGLSRVAEGGINGQAYRQRDCQKNTERTSLNVLDLCMISSWLKNLPKGSRLTNRKIRQLIHFFVLEIPAVRAAREIGINCHSAE